jgi:hypothetical protein
MGTALKQHRKIYKYKIMETNNNYFNTTRPEVASQNKNNKKSKSCENIAN